MKSSNFKLLSIFLISCLGIIVYSNTFHCSFHLDDRSSIYENLSIRNLGDLQTIWNFLPRRFLLYLSVALNYHLNGLDVFGYHLFNLGVHLISALLVWWLTLLILSTPVLNEPAINKKAAAKKNNVGSHADLFALFVGLVFVSHPLQTQAVTYIVQRAASMAALFYVAGLCFYIKSRLMLEKAPNSAAGRIYYVCALLTTVIAMFTKETAITLPLMILLVEFSFLKPKKNFNWAYIIPFLLTIIIIPLTISLTESPLAQQMRGVMPDGPPGITCAHYLFTQWRVILTYIRLAFLPLNQNLDYDYPASDSLFEWPVLLSLSLLIIMLICAVRLFSKYRLISFSIFWFFLTLLPESSFFPIRDVIFEHRLYLPLVGYSLFLVSAMYYLWGKKSLISMIFVLSLAIACNSILTYQRNKIWKDDLTLWGDAVSKSPHKARPYYSIGKAYDILGNFAQAASDYDKAIGLKPDYEEAYNNRGVIYTNQNDLSHALSDFTKAIGIDPTDAIAYNDRGNIYSKHGDLADALSDYNKAIEIKAAYAEAYSNRGGILEKKGKMVQAMSDYNKAIDISPELAMAYDNRGSFLDKQGKIDQAISDFTKAIELNPQDVSAYSDRGGSWAMQGAFSKAISDFNKALEINANYAEAYYNRGLIYDKLNNPTQAISDFSKAIEINPQYAEAYTDRGRIYQKQNNFTKGLSDYNRAIDINPQYATAYNNRAVDYYQLRDYANAWDNVHKAENLGYAVNPEFIAGLKQASGQDN